MTQEQQMRVVAAAQSWNGTPYHADAREKGVGVDCGNLLAAVYHEAGLLTDLPDFVSPPPGWHLHTRDELYLRIIQQYARRVYPPWEPGDMLVYRGRRWPSVGHAGVYVGEGLLIHAVANRRVEAWPLSSSLLTATLDSGWRWDG